MNIDFREFEKEQSKFYQKEVKGKVVKNKNPIKEGTRMTCYLRISVIAVVVIFIMQFFAPESQAESLNEQIESLKRQMEEIQRQNQQQIEELQKKIEGLEQGAKETKAKVEEKEVEAKKEEEGAWWKQVEVSYKKPGDGFKLKTKDGNFSLRTRLRTQFQLSVNDTEDEDVATDFDIRRFRILFDGNAFTPWLLYYVQLRADSTDLELLDTYFDAAYNTLFVPRVGQFKVPFNREQLTSSSELQLVERSIVDAEFTWGRDIGPAVYGVYGNYFTYGAGVFNGNGRNAQSLDSNLLYVGRVQFGCCGELEYKNSSFPSGGDFAIEPNFGEPGKYLLTFGLSGVAFPGLDIAVKTPDNSLLDDRFVDIFGEDADGDPFGEADVYGVTADVNFKYGIFSAEGEYDVRWIDPTIGGFDSVTDQGFRVQGGIFLIPEFIEVAGRFAYIDFDTDVPGPDNSYEITPGLNFYLSRSHKWKIQLSYSFIKDEDTDNESINENIWRAQLQAYF